MLPLTRHRLSRAQICLERHQHEQLRRLARQSGRSISALVRECIEAHPWKEPRPSGKPPLFKFIGAAKGTGESVAENHDLHLYGWKKR
jgi:hypothetical protein